MRLVFITGFLLMVAAQWYAPLSIIVQANDTIDEGHEYLFKTRPVDPSDPFRGKYITLSFEAENYIAHDSTETKFAPYSTVYAVLDSDSLGFAKIAHIQAGEPDNAVDYIPVEFQSGWYDSTSMNVLVRFPFSRFYLEESKASETEQLYWQSRSDSTSVCYAKVKVLNGDTKLTDVIINDSSIVDVVKRINADKVND